jgi:HSP20 family protein
MTIFFDSEIDRFFRRMPNSFFNIDDIFEELKGNGSGSCCYGYKITVGPDGKPVVKEYGNVKPGQLPTSDTREPIVDTIVDQK